MPALHEAAAQTIFPSQSPPSSWTLLPCEVESETSTLTNLPIEDALQLVHLYAERRSPKFEKAAMRWLERYLVESSPRLGYFAEVTASLAKLERD